MLPEELVAGRIVLYDVPWEGYLQTLDWIGDRKQRVTYDRGTMEVEMPSYTHEMISRFINRLVQAHCDRLGVSYRTTGSVTLRRQNQMAGLEGDESFFITHCDAVNEILQKRPLDPERDPAPDLVIEVDLSTDSVGKLPVYARLGVSEVWRLTPKQMVCLHLDRDGEYRVQKASVVLPSFPLGKVLEAVLKQQKDGESATVAWFVSLTPKPMD